MNIIVADRYYQTNFEGLKPALKRGSCILKPAESKEIKKTGSADLFKIKEALRNYIVNYPKRIQYTAKHKKAFLKTEKEYLGKNTLTGYFHDLDKLIMYIIGVPKQLVHNIHVATAPHHVRNGKVKNPAAAVIDWECARFTKPDKPLNARDYYESFFVKKQNIRIPEIEEKLKEFGL